MTPKPDPIQQAICDRLVGLPFVTVHAPNSPGHNVVAELANGMKVRRAEIEQIFNAALVILAIEGGQHFAPAQTAAEKLHEELLATAERLYGTTLADALPIYMGMKRTTYGTWDDRPRVQWPRPVKN